MKVGAAGAGHVFKGQKQSQHNILYIVRLCTALNWPEVASTEALATTFLLVACVTGVRPRLLLWEW